jgi:hypothetical protein
MTSIPLTLKKAPIRPVPRSLFTTPWTICRKNPHRECTHMCVQIEQLLTENDDAWITRFVDFLANSESHYTYGHSVYTCLNIKNGATATKLKECVIKISKKISLTKIKNLLKYFNDNEISEILLNQEVHFNGSFINFIDINFVTTLYYDLKYDVANMIVKNHYDIAKIGLFIRHLLQNCYNAVDKSKMYIVKILPLYHYMMKKESYSEAYYTQINSVMCQIGKLIDNNEIFTKTMDIMKEKCPENNFLKTIKEMFIIAVTNTLNKERNVNRIVTYFKNGELSTFINTEYVAIINKMSHGNERGGTLHLCNEIKQNPELYYLIFYGLKINKIITLCLLNKHIGVADIEKYGIDIDNDIMERCSTNNFYPYKYTNKPNIKVLEIECTKGSNIESIKYLKELGGEFNDVCLINACKLRTNSKVIKFLIEKCNVQVNLECIDKFEKANNFDGLSLMLKKYDDSKPKKEVEETVRELNTNCVMKIDKKKLKYEITNNNFVFDLKDKVISFFKFKDKKYNCIELKLNFLGYLVKNNLTIGKYFIIDVKLSKFFKIAQCVIIDAKDINPILTYFVKNFYPVEDEISTKKVIKKKVTKVDKIINTEKIDEIINTEKVDEIIDTMNNIQIEETTNIVDDDIKELMNL